ncbi:hypothetical protein BWD41_03110 [Citrobacter braakii]|uniref:Uncharacterized protein n=1 Tax=Citrobacter braakii TaxID=57706 RepID=A0AA44LIX6_CITBR|nr:hypothetical protein BWD41_03110 [Citrobacter braakii]POZ45583.1 hypothetical protein CF017_22310 [Citrobacter braakii]
MTLLPCTLSLYKHIHSDMIVQFRYRISKNHSFALIYIILPAGESRQKGVDRRKKIRQIPPG